MQQDLQIINNNTLVHNLQLISDAGGVLELW